jgi:hypothetical protein
VASNLSGLSSSDAFSETASLPAYRVAGQFPEWRVSFILTLKALANFSPGLKRAAATLGSEWKAVKR